MSYEILSLGEVCEFSRGLTYKKSDEVEFSANAVLRANNITLETGEINFDEIKYISDEIEIPASKKVKKDTLLICTASGSKKHLGKVGYIADDIEYSFGGFMGLLKPRADVYPKYLYWLTQSKGYSKFIMGLTDGANINNLKFSQLKDFPVPLPEVREQKRIVAILDQAFADIDKARALTEKNLKNARELFESYLQQVFSQRGEGWVNTSIGEITAGVLTGPFGSLLHKSDYIEDGIPLINPAHISAAGIVPDRKKTVSVETAERLSSYVMEEGDIVIGRRGEMGRCAVVTRKESGYLCGTGSFIIKSSSQCDSGYLVRYLRSASCVSRLEKIAGGAVMPNLSNSELSRFEIWMPPIDQQRKILDLIEELSAETNQVVSVYQRKLIGLEELKRSLLQKAFAGELTTPTAEAAA